MAESHPTSSDGYVYFIQAPNGLIKIGRTRAHPHRRFKALLTGSPVPLERLGCLRGDSEDEHEMHERFMHLRRHGEWFEPGPDLLDFIKCHVPKWPINPKKTRRPKQRTRKVPLPAHVLRLTEAQSARLKAELQEKYGWSDTSDTLLSQ